MKASAKDPDPGNPKAVTNADEECVVVNHSTAEHGYDEPAAARENTDSTPEEKPDETRKREKGRSARNNKPS